MRRIKKVRPMEVSLCNAAANRRVFGLYKSQTKPEGDPLEEDTIAKGGPGSGPHKGGGNTAARASSQGQAQRAKEKRLAANEASEQANKSGESSDHRAATESNRDAALHATLNGDHRSAAALEARADYHSGQAEKAEKLGKSHAGKNLRGAAVNIQDAISNTDPKILEALGAVAKSVGSQDGRSYTPQAASIIKAVGRLLAPFAEELTLSDLQAVGKAAGLGATAGGGDEEETAPAFKSANKGDPEEDAEDEEYDADDASVGEADEDGEADVDEDEEDEETEEEAAKSAQTIAAGSELAQGMSKSKAEDESEDDDVDEEEEPSGTAKAPPFGQPKGAKAKGGKVAKAAYAGQSVDARFEEIMAKHRQLAEENKLLRENFAKSRADLDAERDYRQLDAIKKSIREDYGHLGLDEAKFAPVLKRAKDAEDQSHYQELTSLLKSCNDKVRGAQAAAGIFEAVGKSSQGTIGSSWADRIEARVDEEMKKAAPGTNRAVVADQFFQTPEGREMRKNHRLEKGRI